LFWVIKFSSASYGPNAHTWDRANRLRSLGSTTYAYNGDGNRVQQNAVRYLLDLQPGLVYVIGDGEGSRYVHAPRGIRAAEDQAGNWQHVMTDALGSVRGYIGDNNSVLSNVNYSEYGVPSTPITGFAFTGEWRDAPGIQYHRARYLSPALGGHPSLDLLEGKIVNPLSLNQYSWVQNNPVNLVDPSGKSCMSWDELFIQGWCIADDLTLSDQCFPDPGGRRDGCLLLLREINEIRLSEHSNLYPTFEMLHNCYYCAFTSYLDQYAAYDAMIQAAENDQLITTAEGQRFRLNYLTVHGSAVHDAVLNPNPSLFRDGYIEGLSATGGFIVGVQLGREVVYNFKTFQRSTFSFSGDGWTLPIGGAGFYYGFVDGFAWGNVDRFEDGAFFSQYSGVSHSISVGRGVGIRNVSGSYSTFSTPDGEIYPGIEGYTISIGGGVATDLPSDAGVWNLYYSPLGDRKSYVDQDCRVRMDELRRDIESGSASPARLSPIGSPLGIALNPIRALAIRNAEANRDIFQQRHFGNSCGCRA
jgi:RHS repeat-associated protein